MSVSDIRNLFDRCLIDLLKQLSWVLCVRSYLFYLLLRILILQAIVCKLKIQYEICMTDFTIRTADQLPLMLQAFRKQANLTQTDVAMRLGVTQQTLSALERNAKKSVLSAFWSC